MANIKINSNTRKLVNRLIRAQNYLSKAKALKEAAEAELQSILGTDNVLVAENGDQVLYFKQVNSSILDQKRLKEEMPEVSEKYRKEISYLKTYLKASRLK